MKSWYLKFSSQPHQPFFSSGMIFFIIFLALLLASYSSIISLDSSLISYHAYSMIFIVFVEFFMGFLYVVFPRFLVQAEIKKELYMKHFFLYFLSSLGFLLSILFANSFIFIFTFLLILAQILSFRLLYSIHNSSKVINKYDTKWILISFLFGLISHFVYYLSLFDFTYSYLFEKVAITSGFYLFLFGIIFSISQRMVPFFTQVKVQTYKINKSTKVMEIFFVLMILKVAFIILDLAIFSLIIDIAFFIFIVLELYKWKLPLFKVSAIMWVLYISLYWIPIGFFISILQNSFELFNINFIFEKVSLHTFALGYFSTILLGFGTRVVLGHSGQTPHANKFTTIIFIVLQIIVLLRIFTSFSLNWEFNYIFWINLTTSILLVSLVIWSLKYVKILLKGK